MIQVNDDASLDVRFLPMSVSFHTVALSDDQVPLAFPLIQATWPGVDLTAWRSFVQFFRGQRAAAKSEVLTLCDSAGCRCGVIAYRLDHDLRVGRILAVHLFATIDLANSPQPVRALLDAAEIRASELDCEGIQIRLGQEQSGLASRLRTLGLSPEAGLFWKNIDPAPTRN